MRFTFLKSSQFKNISIRKWEFLKSKFILWNFINAIVFAYTPGWNRRKSHTEQIYKQDQLWLQTYSPTEILWFYVLKIFIRYYLWKHHQYFPRSLKIRGSKRLGLDRTSQPTYGSKSLWQTYVYIIIYITHFYFTIINDALWLLCYLPMVTFTKHWDLLTKYNLLLNIIWFFKKSRVSNNLVQLKYKINPDNAFLLK